MSSSSRSTSRGGKGAKQDASVSNKQQKTDTKTDTTKTDHNPKMQPTAEQMRIAQIIETRTEDPDLRDKIKQVMDATRKTEDEVCTALHDCDNDPDRAVNLLLEGAGTGEWETSGKKKKNRQANAAKSEAVQNNRDTEQEDWEGGQGFNTDRERSRNRGGPPRMRGSLDNRGWRGRENKENEKNLEEGRDGYRRGSGRMMNGPRAGRGGRGGRVGPRTFQNRDKGGFPRSIETWNNPSVEENSGGDALKMEKWGDDFPSPEDWDNEEYTGSLADTKVFTPSAGVAVEPVPSSEPQTEATTTTTVTVSELTSSLAAQTLSSSVASSSSQMSSQNLDLHQQTSQLSQSPVPVGVNTLNAAPSEYLSQFTQSADSLKAAVGIGTSASTSATSYGTTSNSFPVTSSTAYPAPSPPSGFTSTSASFSTSNYVGTTTNYTGQIQEQSLDTTTSTPQGPPQSMPQRTKTARPRVPPPSKIPATAVEMPGDAINNIGYLDVQFGGLEFGSESTFDATAEPTKYPNSTSGSVLDSLPSPRTTNNLDLSSNNQSSPLDAYGAATSQKQTQQSLSSSLGQSQKLSTGDSILPTTEHKTTQPSFPQARGTSSSGLDIDKNEVGLPYSAPSAATYPASYPNQKSSGSSYPTASSYPSSNYSSTQVTTSAPTYQTNQSQMSYTSSGTGSNYSSQTVAPSSYPSSSYSQASAAGVTYQTGPTSYPSITQSTNSFPSASPVYQTTGQSVYGASTLGSSTAYAVSAATAQYQNNYGANVATTAQNHTKLSSALSTGTKEPQYDTTTTVSSNLTSTNATTTNSGLSTVNATPTLGLAAASSSQTVNTTSTKVTSSTGKSGVVPNIPPGVPPLLGTQYIMSQGGLPYFQQPMYSYEDLQLLQQRIPHMATGYYDMGFQAPTSLATGREGGLASVAYSMSDGRYTRADNNASPVPSTLSQQNATQAHQQPMLNPTALPPGYAYFYGGGMMPGGFQYGTPAIYPMQPPATNTHGSTTTTQYPKPGSYGSGYGSGYDGLSQNQDYSKTGYVSGSQTQTKAGVGANAGTTGSSASDLSAVYGKSHVALGKVNSYEKQGFHSGTPPPFNLPGSQNTPMAPSGAYAPHLFIPTMAPHQQHHSTTMMHQPLHQMEMRNPGRRSETGNSSNQRSQSSTQPNKSGTKQGYSPSYWTPN